MKKIIGFIACLLATSTFADNQMGQPGQSGEAMHENNFNQIKQIRINGLQGRISILQTALNCVQSAQKHEAIKACQEIAHGAMKNLEQNQEQQIRSLRQVSEQQGPDKQNGQETGVTHN